MVSPGEAADKRHGGDCEFAGCDADDTHEIRHEPTGETFDYCDDHLPDLGSDTWVGVA